MYAEAKVHLIFCAIFAESWVNYQVWEAAGSCLNVLQLHPSALQITNVPHAANLSTQGQLKPPKPLWGEGGLSPAATGTGNDLWSVSSKRYQ
jgi:hypothetical protein